MAVRDLDLAAYVVTQAVEAIVHNAATERPRDLKSGDLTDEVTQMLIGYLIGADGSQRRS